MTNLAELLINLSPIIKTLMILALCLIGFSLFLFLIEKNRKEALTRLSTWWMIYAYATAAVLFNPLWVIIGLGILSFIVLRELLSCYDLRSSDRYSVFWAYLSIPFQYYFCYQNLYYYAFVFIPVIIFLIIPLRSMLQSKAAGFIRSIAIIQWFIMIAVFCLSHLAMILNFRSPTTQQMTSAGLLVFLLVVAFSSDLIHFAFSKIKDIQPSRLDWKDSLICSIPSVLVALALASLTSFNMIQSIVAGLLISLSSFFGKKCFAAIKNDLEVEKGEKLASRYIRLSNHIASIPFSALIFFHLLFFWYGGV